MNRLMYLKTIDHHQVETVPKTDHHVKGKDIISMDTQKNRT